MHSIKSSLLPAVVILLVTCPCLHAQSPLPARSLAATAPAAASIDPQSAPAAGTGRLTGVVTDQTGGVVPEAPIEVTSLDTGIKRTTLADPLGHYVLRDLPPGRYQVSATSPGFEPAVSESVSVTAGRDAAVDLVLAVARQEQMVVVTAPSITDPLVVETDPRAPRQPIPAHDGADYLKAIPGFSVVRKGGTDGDPVLRGMSGSRVGILLDGQQILGGCGGRMDPPTAYVFPASYDRITVLKGPQTVLYGAGASAGTVLFERDIRRVDQPDVKIASTFTGGSFGRNDELADVRAAIPHFYVQGIYTRSHTDDYLDGNGASVHSLYTRWNAAAAFGWTPDSKTRLEASLARSNGQAAYADRTMDGFFDRNNVAIKFDRRFDSSLVRRIEAQSYYNYIDHVMDNYTLRTPGTTFSASNPDRRTAGGRAAATLAPANRTTIVVGADVQHNVHTGRSAMNKASADAATSALYGSPRVEDMRFTQIGAFTEATEVLSARSRLVGGFRYDWHTALDSRACVAATMCPGNSPLRNATQGATDRKALASGFGRYEYDLGAGAFSGRVTVGIGHSERSPDYWERIKQDPVTLNSAFLSTRPEKTTQLDAGLVWRSRAWSGSVSGFYGSIADYILIRWQPSPTLTRNVDANSTGGEATVAYNFTRNLKGDVTLAYVHADNRTDHRPLAQQPPAEGRLGLSYVNRAFSLGVLARLVASQTRVDVGSGNIVSNGQDLGPTGGFSVFSLNGGYRLKRVVLITAGIDNVLDRAYAEHISQAGAMIPGYVQTKRINEPGRTFWLQVNLTVD